MKVRSERLTPGNLVATLLCSALLTAACGSARSNEELGRAAESASTAPGPAEAPATQTDVGTVPAAAPAADGATSDGAAAAPSATNAGGTGSTPGAPGAGTQSKPASAAPTPASPSAGKAGATSTGTAPKQSAPSAGAGGASPAVPSLPAPGAPTGGQKSEIVLGSIGTQSGVLGQVMLPIFQTAPVWMADVNARGGLNGHKVRIVLADDGGDPNKALGLARRMVEQDKVVAFFADHGPTSYQAVVPYLERQQVPIIAGSSTSIEIARSSMGFSVGLDADEGVTLSHVLPLLALSDKRKVSLIYCAEVATCKGIRDTARKLSNSLGFQIVHEAQATLSQPDYTAEVLAARNAGAEVLVLALENYSVQRLKQSADRQNYRPVIATQKSGHDSRFEGKTGLEGVLIGSDNLHWASPKLADYRSAIRKYGPDTVLGSFSIGVWAQGKLLEKLAHSFGDKVTSAEVIKALRGLRGETVGGLIPPLTYATGNEPSQGANACIIPMTMKDGQYIVPNGDDFFCAPGWKPPAA